MKYFDRDTWGTLLTVFLFGVVVIVVDYKIRGKVDLIYTSVFLLTCIMASIVTIRTQEAKHELEKWQIELEMKEIYGDAYKELVLEVRRRQHDFRNQLGAIYSMHLTADSLEDLIAKQSEYGAILLEQCRYDRILTGCNNPILAGYLYYRCTAYEKYNVQVEYQVHVDRAQCALTLHEMIEILGILLTNAFESIKPEDQEKCIGLYLQEHAESLIIEVSNKTEELPVKQIEKMFQKGYSSKGKNRGLGLARVKEVSQKTNADLIIENRKKGNDNWMSIRMIVPKLG